MAYKKKGKRYEDDEKLKELIWDLAHIGCTYPEIASITGVPQSRLHSKFKELIEDGMSDLKMSLRRKQIKMAMEGSERQMSKLADHYLGQSESLNINHKHEEVKDVDSEQLIEVIKRAKEDVDLPTQH
jgi:hypothetical protein